MTQAIQRIHRLPGAAAEYLRSIAACGMHDVVLGVIGGVSSVTAAVAAAGTTVVKQVQIQDSDAQKCTCVECNSIAGKNVITLSLSCTDATVTTSLSDTTPAFADGQAPVTVVLNASANWTAGDVIRIKAASGSEIFGYDLNSSDDVGVAIVSITA